MVETWVFFGRILPERFPLRVTIPDAEHVVAEFGLAYNTSIGIADGQLVAEVSITKGAVDINTMRNLVDRDIRIMTDIIGYNNAFAYDVDIISAACRETGARWVFGVIVPVLSQRRGGVFSTNLDSALWAKVRLDPGAQTALANFREAIKIPVDTAFFCYRAIEAMMQSVRRGTSEKENQAWERLRISLRIKRSAIDYVKTHADPPRHGRPKAITDGERAMVFHLTDEIVRRYLDYLVRDRTPLPESEFPTLEHLAPGN